MATFQRFGFDGNFPGIGSDVVECGSSDAKEIGSQRRARWKSKIQEGGKPTKLMAPSVFLRPTTCMRHSVERQLLLSPEPEESARGQPWSGPTWTSGTGPPSPPCWVWPREPQRWRQPPADMTDVAFLLCGGDDRCDLELVNTIRLWRPLLFVM